MSPVATCDQVKLLARKTVRVPLIARVVRIVDERPAPKRDVVPDPIIACLRDLHGLLQQRGCGMSGRAVLPLISLRLIIRDALGARDGY